MSVETNEWVTPLGEKKTRNIIIIYRYYNEYSLITFPTDDGKLPYDVELMSAQLGRECPKVDGFSYIASVETPSFVWYWGRRTPGVTSRPTWEACVIFRIQIIHFS